MTEYRNHGEERTEADECVYDAVKAVDEAIKRLSEVTIQRHDTPGNDEYSPQYQLALDRGFFYLVSAKNELTIAEQ